MDSDSDNDRQGHGGQAKGGKPRKVSEAQLRAAVSGSRGQRSTIAAELQISLRSLDRYLERYPDIKQEYQDERDTFREYCTDKALTNVYKALEDGDAATSRWVLDRLGAEYGFTPKQALVSPDGEQPIGLNVNIIVDDSKIKDPITD